MLHAIRASGSVFSKSDLFRPRASRQTSRISRDPAPQAKSRPWARHPLRPETLCTHFSQSFRVLGTRALQRQIFCLPLAQSGPITTTGIWQYFANFARPGATSNVRVDG